MFRTIRSRLVLGVALVVGSGVALTVLHTIQREGTVFRKLADESLEARSHSIQTQLIREMELGGSARIRDILIDASGHPEVLAARIVRPDGVILRSAEAEEEGKLASRTTRYAGTTPRTFVERRAGHKVRVYLMPVVNRQFCHKCHGTQPVLGIINLELAAEREERLMSSNMRTAVLVALAAIACICLGTWMVVRMTLDSRISPLSEAMRRVEAGDLSVRAHVVGRDEIDDLATRFNVMVAQLQAAQDRLTSYHAEQMEKAERLATLGELAAGIAHEIKNPLAGIAGAMELIGSEMDSSDPRKEILDEVQVQVNRLSGTIRDLLSFARPAKPDLHPARVDEILSAALALFTAQINEHKIRLVTGYDGALPAINVDAGQIRQVFMNLILNAIQAMPRGGTLRVSTSLTNGRGGKPSFLRADVTDSGNGIDSSVLQEIFVPFFTTKHRGTGLGLSIARRIVEAHHGLIEAASTPGQGSTFSVFLPLEVETEKPQC